MSSYKIYAKKGKKVMPIKIEEKHYYNNIRNDIQIYQITYGSAMPIENFKGMGVNRSNVYIIHNSNNTSVSQGTGENQRVGNKINIKSISFTCQMNFVSNNLVTYFSHSQMIDTNFHFRIMTVKFNQQMTDTDIGKWFRESHIYYFNETGSDGSMPVCSNWTNKLRESTPWTGQFKILMDKKFSMTKSDSFKQISFTIPVKGQVNFDNTSNRPTDNQYFSNIYTFIMTPAFYKADMDPISHDKAENLTTDRLLFQFRSNIKTIYYDV